MEVKLNKTNHKNQYFAAIDLGSRNCRLIIAKKQDDSLIEVESLSKFILLGHDILKFKKFSHEVISSTIDMLSHFTSSIRKYPDIKYKVVATEASRIAKNKTLLVNQARKHINLKLEIISSKQEAYFAALGCSDMINPQTRYAIIFDIGGCSTEVILIEQRESSIVIIDTISIPLGVVNIALRIKESALKAYNEIYNEVINLVKDFNLKNDIPNMLKDNICQIISTSGTATTIATLHKNLKMYDVNKINGTTLSFSDCNETIKIIQCMTHSELLLHPAIGKNKADYILGSLAIFSGIYTPYKNLDITITDSGVCWGIIKYLTNEKCKNTHN